MSLCGSLNKRDCSAPTSLQPKATRQCRRDLFGACVWCMILTNCTCIQGKRTLNCYPVFLIISQHQFFMLCILCIYTQSLDLAKHVMTHTFSTFGSENTTLALPQTDHSTNHPVGV